MRPSLAPGLLSAAGRNLARGQRHIALFEVGQIFRGDGEDDQGLSAAGIRRGAAKPEREGRHWSGPMLDADVFDAKADALALLGALGISLGGLTLTTPGPNWLHPGRSAELRFGPRNAIGWFGEFHPAALEALDLEGPACGFEIFLEALPAPKARTGRARPKLDLPELMALERDFAFVVDRNVAAADLVKAVQAVDRTLITEVGVFDVYEGPGLAPGKKSVALAVKFQPRRKTLTDSEIEAVSNKIVAEAAKRFGGALR